jgi:hypothetical protein
VANRLDPAELRRAWASAQLLSADPPATAVDEVVARLVGVQAQDRTAAALAVRARTRHLTTASVHAAAVGDRAVVLTWSLRGTRHLHLAADVRWIVGLLGPTFAHGSPRRNRQLGIDGVRGEEALRALRRALEADGRLTRADVRRRLADAGVDPHGQAPVHLLRRAGLEGWLCVVPGRGPEETYVVVDDWLPPAGPVAPDDAGAELARRYLAGYGPAAPSDFAAWSGLGLTVARRAWAALAGDVVEVDEPRGRSWVLRGGCGAGGGPTSVRLLGGFDNLLLGYADRSPVLAPEHARKVNVGGGMVRPVVVVDGRVVATWRHRAGRGGYRVEVAAFGGLPGEVHSAIDDEIVDVGRFLGTPAVSAGAGG